MKKFIAGVVLTVVAFMALTVGASAKSGNGGGNYKQRAGNGYAGQCNGYNYYSDPDYTC